MRALFLYILFAGDIPATDEMEITTFTNDITIIVVGSWQEKAIEYPELTTNEIEKWAAEWNIFWMSRKQLELRLHYETKEPAIVFILTITHQYS